MNDILLYERYQVYLIYIHKHMYTYIFFKIIKTTCKKKVDTRSQRFMMHAHD